MITADELRRYRGDIIEVEAPAFLLGVIERAARTIDYDKSRAKADAARIRELGQEIQRLQRTMTEKNAALDAMHWVWCAGGCPGGVHRWPGEPIAEETVVLAERNTARLRSWWNNAQHKAADRILEEGV